MVKRKPGVQSGSQRGRSYQLDPNGMERYLDHHLEWMGVKGYSPETIKTRNNAIRRFIQWSEERSLDQPQQVTKPILERYQRHLYYYRKQDGKPLTLGTQQGLLAPIKTFFKWLTQENHLLYNPASELQLPRQPKRLPRDILNIEEVETILSQAEPGTASGLRDRAVMELLYSTGIRRIELAHLKTHDIDLQRGVLMIREGKGKRDRVLPIGSRAQSWLEKYLEESRPALMIDIHEDALFLNDYGEAQGSDHIARRIKRYMQQADIHKHGSCHLFRHAMATHMLDNGADIRFIQAMLGHADLSTTEIYTHVSIEKLKEIHAATHPAKLTRTENNQSPSRDDLLSLLAAEQDEEADDPENS